MQTRIKIWGLRRDSVKSWARAAICVRKQFNPSALKQQPGQIPQRHIHPKSLWSIYKKLLFLFFLWKKTFPVDHIKISPWKPMFWDCFPTRGPKFEILSKLFLIPHAVGNWGNEWWGSPRTLNITASNIDEICCILSNILLPEIRAYSTSFLVPASGSKGNSPGQLMQLKCLAIGEIGIPLIYKSLFSWIFLPECFSMCILHHRVCPRCALESNIQYI